MAARKKRRTVSRTSRIKAGNKAVYAGRVVSRKKSAASGRMASTRSTGCATGNCG